MELAELCFHLSKATEWSPSVWADLTMPFEGAKRVARSCQRIIPCRPIQTSRLIREAGANQCPSEISFILLGQETIRRPAKIPYGLVEKTFLQFLEGTPYIRLPAFTFAFPQSQNFDQLLEQVVEGFTFGRVPPDFGNEIENPLDIEAR